MATVVELSPDEKRAYDRIVSRDGLLQSDLWKDLDVSSRKGSRLATSLADQGLIEREQTTANGRRTYLLTPTTDDDSGPTEPDHESQTDPDDDGPAAGLDARDQRALTLINERGGIYQSEFWKELDVSSRTGSRIATRLADAGLIRREEATYNGQRTYRLLPAKKELDFSLLMAGDMISPLIDSGEDIDPIESDAFTEWLLQLAHNERDPASR